MSWNSYIDSVIAYSRDASGNAHVDKVCIIGMKGGMWTTNSHPANYNLSPTECFTIAKNLKAGDLGHNLYNGIFLEGEKFQYLKFDADTRMVLGKKVGYGAVTIQPSKSAIVVAHCPEGAQYGHCNNSVSKIVQHLETSGY